MLSAGQQEVHPARKKLLKLFIEVIFGARPRPARSNTRKEGRYGVVL